jgi:hypothetical protein
VAAVHAAHGQASTQTESRVRRVESGQQTEEGQMERRNREEEAERQRGTTTASERWTAA